MPSLGNSVPPKALTPPKSPSADRNDGPTKTHVAPHRQSSGDVARAHGVKRSEILKANPRLNHQPYLAPKDRAEIPQNQEARSKRHTVQTGETPRTIATQHGVTESALREENGLEPHEDVSAGEELNIPENDDAQDDTNGVRTTRYVLADRLERTTATNVTGQTQDPVSTAAETTDAAAARVVETRLPPPDLLSRLPRGERDEMVANANQAKAELDQAVEAEIQARVNSPGQPPLTFETLHSVATQAVATRFNGTQSEIAVKDSLERVETARQAELNKTPLERAQERTDAAAERVRAAEDNLASIEASGVTRYVSSAADAARTELADAQAELHEAIRQELAMKVDSNTIPPRYLNNGDVTGYYAEQIGDRIGLTPGAQSALDSAVIAYRVTSAAESGGPQAAMAQLRALTPGLPPDVLQRALNDPEMQQVADEVAAYVANEVANVYAQSGEYEPYMAAEKLAELTAGLPPDVAAEVIEASMPSIQNIIDSEMENNLSTSGATLEALSSALGAAQGSAKGEAVTSEVAAMLIAGSKEHGNEMGYAAWIVAEELSKAVGRGADASLTVELARQAAVTGDIDGIPGVEYANNLLRLTSDQLVYLQNEAQYATEEYAKQSQELAWILSGPAKYATPEEQQAIIDEYRASHPELVAAEERLNKLGGQVMRTADALVSLPPELRGLPAAQQLEQDVAELTTDKHVEFAVSSSSDAQQVVSDMLDRADKGEDTLLSHLKDITAWIEQPTNFVKNMGGLVTKAIAGKAIQALGPDGTNVTEAGKQLDRLNQYADFLGLDQKTMSEVVDQFKIAANPDTTPEARNAALATVNEKLNEVEGGAYAVDSSLGKTFRGIGVALSLVGTLKSFEDAINDPNAQNVVTTLVSSAGLARDTAEFASAFMKTADWTDSWWFKGSGKVLGVVGTFLGGISIAQSLADGEFADAGFAAAGLAGGLLLASSSLLWTGVGAFLVVGSFVGKAIYDEITDDEHENATTEAALRQMGFDPEAAKILRNQDDDLNSPVPVLMALAENSGIDLKDPVQRQGFIDYINSLDNDKLDDLVHAAHGVDPKDDGTYPKTASNDSYVINGRPANANPRVPYDLNPHSVTALAAWMENNGFKVPPTL